MLIVYILYGLFVLLGLLYIGLQDIHANARKRAFKSWDEEDEKLPTIKDIQKQIVEMGGDICVNGRLSSEMEEVWNELYIKQYEVGGAARNWLVGE